ncbi:MAG TPA: Uma2 family endonuclease [Bryobacteraceae bacterium]
MTFQEFLRMPEPLAGHYELHHGKAVLIPARKKLHMRVQQDLFDLLSPQLRSQGFLTIEFAFRPASEDEAWQADVGFVLQNRWDKDDNEYFLGAPDLVIEVLSKSNTMDEILDRQDTCLTNGCTAFWTVDPKRQIVMVTTPDRKTVTVDRGGFVALPEPLEGGIEAAALFA